MSPTSACCPRAAADLRDRSCTLFSGECSLCNVLDYRSETEHTESSADDSDLQIRISRKLTRTSEIRLDIYRMRPKSGDTPACSAAFQRRHPARQGPVAAMVIVVDEPVVVRRLRLISAASAPHDPWHQGPSPRMHAMPPCSWASSQMMACPCQRRSAAGGTGKT